MNPALSIVFFTTLAGCGQGLAVALAVAQLAGQAPAPGFVVLGYGVACALLLAGLAASFLHLGRKMRAWRAATMWRTSWMAREVIVLPACIAVVALAGMAVLREASPAVQTALAWGVICAALLLWLCTAMIYAAIRFVQEWAHPLTVINYTLIGLSSGLVATAALAVLAGQAGFALMVAPWALGFTLAAWALRALALGRNARLVQRSTLQSATGIRSARVAQQSMGMTAGSYNTREFFHPASPAAFQRIKSAFIVCGFALPSVLLLAAVAGVGAWVLLLVLPIQYAGLLAERWFFFAQARHPQNLYYQTVA